MSLEKVLADLLKNSGNLNGESNEDLLKKLEEVGKVVGEGLGSTSGNPIETVLKTFVGGNLKDGLGKMFEGSPDTNIFDTNIFDTDIFAGGIFAGGNTPKETTENKSSGFGLANVTETDKAFKITVTLPGASKSNIKVSAEDDVIKLDVQIAENTNVDGVKTIINEYTAKSFVRTFKLDKADNSKLVASFKNGELSIDVPKVEIEPVFFSVK